MKIVVLCSHKPEIDPRVVWIYESLSKIPKATIKVLFFSKEKSRKKNLEKNICLVQCKLRDKHSDKHDVDHFSHFLIFFKKRCPRLYDLFYVLKLIKNIYNALFPRIDSDTKLIYANDLETLPSAYFFKKKHPKTKLIYDCHEFYPHSHTNAPFWYSFLLILIEKFFIRHVDVIFSVNPLIAKKIEKTYGKKVISILNAEPYKKEKPSLKEPFLNKKKVNFLFQGGYRPCRGLEEFLEAWEDLNPKNACLYLRGAGGEKGSLERQVRFYKTFKASLFFIDPVQEEELVQEARYFDVGLIPYKPIDTNYKYCCPNKLSQYMHAGLSIIGSRTEFVSETINKYKLGTVYDAENSESIQKAILKLCDDRQFLSDSKKASLKTAKNIFNWQQEEKKLLKVVKTLI